MSNIDFSRIPKIEYPRLAIYLLNPYQLEGLITGKARITNLPEDAKIYKVVPWMADQCDSIIAVWFSHPSFDEVPYGNLVKTRYFQWEERQIDITKLPIVETKEYWPVKCSEPEDFYFNKE